MEDELRCLGHAGYRPGGEESKLVDAPGVLIGLYEVATVVRILDLIEKELAVGLDGINASGGKKLVKVLVEAADVFLRDHQGLISSYAIFRLHFHSLIFLRNLATRSNTAPIAMNSMPDCDMLDVLVLASNVASGSLEASWEASFVCFKL